MVQPTPGIAFGREPLSQRSDRFFYRDTAVWPVKKNLRQIADLDACANGFRPTGDRLLTEVHTEFHDLGC